jgi:hypothetical protein
MNSNERLKAWILLKLIRKRRWGARHTAFEHLCKSAPSHLRGKLRDAAKELVREGLIKVKPTFYGKQVSLNPEFCERIEEIVRKHARKLD